MDQNHEKLHKSIDRSKSLFGYFWWKFSKLGKNKKNLVEKGWIGGSNPWQPSCWYHMMRLGPQGWPIFTDWRVGRRRKRWTRRIRTITSENSMDRSESGNWSTTATFEFSRSKSNSPYMKPFNLNGRSTTPIEPQVLVEVEPILPKTLRLRWTPS